MHEIAPGEVAALECANYLAMQSWVQALPGGTVAVRDDVIITRARLFPVPDLNHACLVRAADGQVNALLDDVVGALHGLARQAHVFVSAACTPPDLGERLLARGFRKEADEEPWLCFDLRGWLPPPVGSEEVEVARAGPEDARNFARVYLAAFGMPTIAAPLVAPLFRRLMQVPSTRYTIASVQGQPAGVCLWHTHGDVVTLGGLGVLPRFRGRRVATTLGMHVMLDAQAEGKMTLVAQMIHPAFESFVRQYGFRRVFTRTHYLLPGQDRGPHQNVSHR